MERVHAGTEAAPTAHPVVGLWSWDLAHMNPRGARSFAIFHADGTFVDANPFLCTGVGLWQATGERTADLLIYYHDARTDAGSNLLNVVIAKGPVEVNDAGQALTLLCTYEVKALDGVVVDSGAQTETATRITM
jgi:hypothetical protein